ncbi:MAG: hypothetical protein WAK93_13500 [Solirubrobacteraceae bacterium]
MTLRRRVLAGLALIGAVVVMVVIVVVNGSSSSKPASANSGGASETTVQRRNLVQTDTEAGTLSYSNPQTVYDRLGGTITALPSVGQVIKPGGTLFRVDGAPVILMNGHTPAYRDLSPADPDGTDVLELNRNLVALGFDAGAITVSDVWQAGTTDGVDLLQESLGELPTGSLSLGQVVFLPGDQLVSAVDGTLGATGGGSGSANGSGSGATDAALDPEPSPEFVSLNAGNSGCLETSTSSCSKPRRHPAHTHTRKAPRSRPPGGAEDGQTLAALSALLRAESAQLKAETAQLKAAKAQGAKSGSGTGGSSSGTGDSGASGSGSGSGAGGSAQPILQTTSTHLVVTVQLSASSQSEAVIGDHVTVQMPAGNIVGGRITGVSSVAESSSGSGASGSGGGNGSGATPGGTGGAQGANGSSSSTIPVTVALNGHHTGAGLDQASVSVNFAQERADHVLSVPVTALLATAGGNYAVQEAAAPHQLLKVTTGLFAAGDVQISGPGLYPGLQVTDSQG